MNGVCFATPDTLILLEDHGVSLVERLDQDFQDRFSVGQHMNLVGGFRHTFLNLLGSMIWFLRPQVFSEGGDAVVPSFF